MNAPAGRKSSGKKLSIRFDEIAPTSLSGQFMRRFWQPVCIAADLKPGKAKPLRVLGESFTLYRGQTGTLHLTEFRCPHRGVQLSVGWIEGDDIRCLYHGWKFDAQGQCVEQPGEKKGGFAHKIGIATYPVQEYLGLIFGFFGPGEPPPLPRYTAFETGDYIDCSMYVRDCNYFQNIENGVDEVHVNFTHGYTAFSTSGLNDEVPEVAAEERPYGLVEYAFRTGDRVRETHFLMPNILFLKLPQQLAGEDGWRDYVSWRVPIDDHVHMSFIVQRLSLDKDGIEIFKQARADSMARAKTLEPWRDIAKKILAGEMTLQDAEGHEDLVTIQDYVTQCGQGIVADRVNERLGQSDVAIILLRKLWDREIRAMADGRELTQWQVPEGLTSTIGL
jgi:5,5'-dehydrodivanillate O-demethylase